MPRGQRSIRAQLNYAITRNCKIGTSKRADKANGYGKGSGKIYSVGRAENLRNTADSLSKFMKEKHPEIKQVKDINSRHIKEWLSHKEKDWSNKTLQMHADNARMLNTQINNTFNSSKKWDFKVNQKVDATNIRTQAFTRSDLDRVKAELQNGRSEGIKALEITSRTGLRVSEVAWLKPENINLEKNVIEVRHAKNGRYRDVPIRSHDRGYFKELKADTSNRAYITNGVQAESLNKAIRRAMDKVGISEKYPNSTDHAIRKMYARERFMQELNRGLDKNAAWGVVQQELGHGAEHRQELFNTYVGAI